MFKGVMRPSIRGATMGLLGLMLLGGCKKSEPAATVVPEESKGPMQIAPMASLDSIAAAKTPLDRGRELYGYHCMDCHGAGKDHPGTAALQKKYGGSKPATLADRTDLTPNLVKYYVRTGVSIMPFFRKTEINDTDLNDLATYLSRNVGAQPEKAKAAQ